MIFMQTTSRTQMQAAIGQYFKAWESQDPELLTDVFARDAKYLAQPFGIEEYEGLEAIKDYWRAKPVSIQVNPKPVVISRAFGKNYCFLEWETTFTTLTHTTKVVRGMMWLGFENGLVKELREHYASKETA